MKNQAYRMALLYDFYGDMLTDRQKEFYDLYYNEDLSLAEIAENYGITRQGVRDVIVRAEAILTELEDKTGIILRRLGQETDSAFLMRPNGYAYLSQEQQEALKRKGFRVVEPERKAQKPEQATAEAKENAPEPERKEEEAEAPENPQPEEKGEKPKGRRAKGEKDG